MNYLKLRNCNIDSLDFCLFFGLYSILSVLYRYMCIVHNNTFEKMIIILRVILVEYEEHKIKYELFCVYCERFSRVTKIINRISHKYNYITFDTLEMIRKGFFSPDYSNCFSAGFLCHTGLLGMPSFQKKCSFFEHCSKGL